MKYSIIIPTMWKSLDTLTDLRKRSAECSLIGEVILINNTEKQIHENLQYNTRVLNAGKNIYVNPAWNWGVSEAKHEGIIIANDDIFIDYDFNRLMVLIDDSLSLYPDSIIGFEPNCFIQRRTEDLGHLRITSTIEKRGYGFGVFMVMHRNTYREIPEQLKVWYGDDYLCAGRRRMLIKGVNVETAMRSTSRTLDLTHHRIFEKKFYKQIKL